MSDSWRQAPVLLMVFNRPDTTERVFEQIRAARPERLFITADGPRPNRPDDVEKCKAVRAVVERVDWECDVRHDFSEVNLGCKRRVASAIDWVFNQVEEAIILEDDCVPHPSFFPYCHELLERYRDDGRIMAISGDHFLKRWRRNQDSYFFSRYVHIWGWATWRRSWKLYDAQMKLWPTVRDGGWLMDIFGDEISAARWRRILQSTYDGDIDTWDYQLLFAAWMNRCVGVIPYTNMTSNLGFRADATHTPGYVVEYAEKQAMEMSFPLKHPEHMIRNAQADAITQQVFYSPPKFPDRVRRKIFSLLRQAGVR